MKNNGTCLLLTYTHWFQPEPKNKYTVHQAPPKPLLALNPAKDTIVKIVKILTAQRIKIYSSTNVNVE